MRRSFFCATRIEFLQNFLLTHGCIGGIIIINKKNKGEKVLYMSDEYSENALFEDIFAYGYSDEKTEEAEASDAPHSKTGEIWQIRKGSGFDYVVVVHDNGASSVVLILFPEARESCNFSVAWGDERKYTNTDKLSSANENQFDRFIRALTDDEYVDLTRKVRKSLGYESVEDVMSNPTEIMLRFVYAKSQAIAYREMYHELVKKMV